MTTLCCFVDGECVDDLTLLCPELIAQSTDELIWMSHAQSDGDIWVIRVRMFLFDRRNIRENIAVPTLNGEVVLINCWKNDLASNGLLVKQ